MTQLLKEKNTNLNLKAGVWEETEVGREVGRVIRHLGGKNLLKGLPTLEQFFYYVD